MNTIQYAWILGWRSCSQLVSLALYANGYFVLLWRSLRGFPFLAACCTVLAKFRKHVPNRYIEQLYQLSCYIILMFHIAAIRDKMAAKKWCRVENAWQCRFDLSEKILCNSCSYISLLVFNVNFSCPWNTELKIFLYILQHLGSARQNG